MNVPIRELDYLLSIKLGDPVLDNGDGEVFDLIERFAYLEKAYNKTVRLLRVAMGIYAPIFAKKKYTKKIIFTKGESEFDLDSYSEIEQVYVSYSLGNGKGSTALAMRSSEDSYLSTKYGLNSQKTPSFTEKIIYYTIVDDKIKLLPEASSNGSNGYYSDATVLYLNDGIKVANVNSNLPIERNYIDLVLNFACVEGMLDINRNDKANAFLDDAFAQIKLLQQLALNKKREVGVSK